MPTGSISSANLTGTQISGASSGTMPVKLLVEHADDGELLAANAEALAEHRRVGAELALPVAIRQNDRSRCRRGVVFGVETFAPAAQRLRASAK